MRAGALVLAVLAAVLAGPAGAEGPSTVDTLAGAFVGDGRAGTETHLRWPVKVEVDAQGKVYWFEQEGGYFDGFREVTHRTGSQRVRMWEAATGRVRTVAGHGKVASLVLLRDGDGAPATTVPVMLGGMALDSRGNLYLHDIHLEKLRRVDATTGIMTTIADAPVIQAAPLAVDRHDRVYFTRIVQVGSTYDQYIRRYDPRTEEIVTIAGGGEVDLDGQPATSVAITQPQDLAVDDAGNVFFSHPGGVLNGDRIRWIDPTGVIRTLVGGPTARTRSEGAYGALFQLQGANYHRLLSRPDGSVWFTDKGTLRRLSPVQEIDELPASRRVTTLHEASGAFADGPVERAAFGYLTDVAPHPAGGYVVADLTNRRIRLVRDGVVTTLVGNGLRTSGYDPPSVYSWTGDGGPAANAYLPGPRAVAVDGEGNVYVAESGLLPSRALIRRVDARSGLITTVAGTGPQGYSGDGGPATQAQIGVVWDLAFDADGDLYLADGTHRVIRRIDAATGIITTVAGDGANRHGGDGGPATSASFSFPASIALAPDGTMFVGDAYARRIRKVDPTGTITTVAGTGETGYSGDGGPALAATFEEPRSLALLPDGTLLFADATRIRALTPDGLVETVAGSGSKIASGEGDVAWRDLSLKYPGDLVYDPQTGSVFVADTFHQQIRRLDRDGRARLVAGQALTDVDEGEETVYWGDLCGDGAPARTACFHYPRTIALTPTGDLVVADEGNNRVRIVSDVR